MDDSKRQTEHQDQPKSYATFTELIGTDPGNTYMGGTFRDEKHTIHSLNLSGNTLSARVDVDNEYAGSAHFHLTQIAAYSLIGQLGLGYLCYKYNVGKDALGMATPVELLIRWNGLVTDAANIPVCLEELECSCEGGQYTSKVAFDIGNGVATGHVIGGYTLKKS